MYKWYGNASLCLAYLADVHDVAESGDSVQGQLSAPGSEFRESEWFTRGWTLQELIAPERVVFLCQAWRLLGTKAQLAEVFEEITGIGQGVLLHEESLHEISVARRMSWAAHRVTTKPEDLAYCLLGIFDITMPTTYGKGCRAFHRLQEEILRTITHTHYPTCTSKPRLSTLVRTQAQRRPSPVPPPPLPSPSSPHFLSPSTHASSSRLPSQPSSHSSSGNSSYGEACRGPAQPCATLRQSRSRMLIGEDEEGDSGFHASDFEGELERGPAAPVAVGGGHLLA
ncbi:hypothetical protein DICSQDRAFT_167595 [Dichomitus squalens LYAD-421 SS1]|uniref:uncharacterized protein n=1 Tax=Dichomitus squalens (strain LYAD-421) TaxID=732165 RepID=UPI0004411760|nr:uncharacterized protein DICSQDRAFT_167595 [Dichomitus squalens LYAD-421 SS1]EJF64438.1 hypothetical protein DICSQDRAFT_167595 [Dichomitus squalens LYAD-421 SS1]